MCMYYVSLDLKITINFWLTNLHSAEHIEIGFWRNLIYSSYKGHQKYTTTYMVWVGVRAGSKPCCLIKKIWDRSSNCLIYYYILQDFFFTMILDCCFCCLTFCLLLNQNSCFDLMW